MGRRSRRAAAPPPEEVRGSTEELLSRGERRKLEDDRLRASLRPLEPGERPTALKVAAGIALVLGLSNLIAGLAGLEVSGTQPPLSGVIGFSGLILLAAWGMWTQRYWAVLGFQCLLGIIIVLFALFLLRASNAVGVLVAIFFVVAPGVLFWKLVRVLARMQVPERPGAGPRVT